MSDPQHPHAPGAGPFQGGGQQPYSPQQGGGFPQPGGSGPSGGQPHQPYAPPGTPGGGQQYTPSGGGYGSQGPGGAGGPTGPGGPGGPGWQGGAPFGEAPEPKSSKRTGLVIGLAVALVLVVAGGAFAVTRFLGGPTGPQPSDALPADAVGYFRIDLDPGGGQKLNAYNYLKKFPAVADKLGSEDEDFRETIFNLIKESEPDDLEGVDYAADVEPWLGNRVGFAALPGAEGNTQEEVVALQVTDQAAAEEGLKKLGTDDTGVAFVGEYAVLAETQKDADKYAQAAEENPLSSNEQFVSDEASLDDLGFASFWMDAEQLASSMGASATGSMGMGGMPTAQGRIVGAFKFEEDYAEVTGKLRGGLELQTQPEASQASTLPDSTVAAISIGGAGPSLTSAWGQIEKSISGMGQGAEMDTYLRMFEDQLGVKIPDDIATLLGSDTSIALDEDGLDTAAQGAGLPKVGARFTTDVGKAEPVLDKLLTVAQQGMAQSGQAIPLEKASSGGSLAVATTKDYADSLVQGGNLGEQEAFTLAVPDPEAQMVVYLDFDKIESLALATAPPEAAENMKPIQSIGVSSRADEDGSGEFSLRVVAN